MVKGVMVLNSEGRFRLDIRKKFFSVRGADGLEEAVVVLSCKYSRPNWMGQPNLAEGVTFMTGDLELGDL